MEKQDRTQLYRVNFKLRRRGQAELDRNKVELKSEDFDTDVEYCQAVASELFELITADREYLEGTKDNDD